MLSTIFSFSLGDVYLNKNIVKAEGEKKVVNVDRIYKDGFLENLDYNLSMMPTNLSGIRCGNGYCYATKVMLINM